MKTGTAWSIRGVDDATREAALEAARRSGLSVGEWIRTVLADDETQVGHEGAAVRPDGTSEGIVHLDRRLSEMERSSRDAFESLAAQIQESRGATEASTQRTNVSDMVAALARELDNPDEHARTLVEGRGAWRRGRDSTPQSDLGTVIRDIDRRITDMSERLDQPPHRGVNTESLTDISARLNAMLAGNTPARGVKTGAVGAALKDLEARIDTARARLGAGSAAKSENRMATATAPRRLADVEARLTELTQRTSTSTSPNPAGGRVKADPLAGVIDEIAERQRTLDDHTGLNDGGQGDAAITAAIAALKDDISALAGQISAISRTGAEDQGAYFQLVRRIDALAAEAPLERTQLENLRAELQGMLETLTQNTRLDRARLDALGEEVSALRQAIQGRDDAEPLLRLEAQLAELAQSVEANSSSISNANPTQHLGRLESRIEAIASRMDDLISHASAPAAMDEIKAEIAAIRHDITARAQSDMESLENQIRELAGQVEGAASSEPDPQALDELEARISGIAADLEHNQIGGETLNRLENSLATVQSHLADNEQQSVEAARTAALDAVRELSSASGDDAQPQLVEDLKRDLEKLRHAAGDRGEQTGAALDSVNQTISQVVGRLTRLEAQAVEAVEEAQLAEPAVPRAPLQDTTDQTLPAGDGRDETSASTDELPGSQGDSGDNRAQPQDPRERRADFIAAARRAAQAAAAESQSARTTTGGSDDTGPSDGPFKRIRRAIDGRKRSLLLAAAAIVIAIGAMQIYGDVGPASGDDLITDTNAAVGGTKFRSFAAGSAVTPVPGSADSALIAPVPDPDHDAVFAAPLSAGSGFIKQPPGEAAEFASAAKPVGAVPADAAANTRPDPAIGSPDLVAAAQAGDAAAAFEIAARYAEGLRVHQDMKLARYWYEPAARGGIAVAQYRLGSFYERGVGGPKDLTKAVDWYQRSADQGNINAMHNLAVLMSEGGERAPNHAKALQWFTAAANYGVADSQYNLGVLYARGIGPNQDLLESYKWFAVAAVTGDRDAAKRRDEVADLLSQEDLGRARAAFQSWAKRPALAEANTVTSAWTDATSISAADRRALVGKIQALLADRGFDPGPSDGLVGPRTRQAVLAFQRQNGIATTGRIDRNLIAALSASPL